MNFKNKIYYWSHLYLQSKYKWLYDFLIVMVILVLFNFDNYLAIIEAKKLTAEEIAALKTMKANKTLNAKSFALLEMRSAAHRYHNNPRPFEFAANNAGDLKDLKWLEIELYKCLYKNQPKIKEWMDVYTLCNESFINYTRELEYTQAIAKAMKKK